MAEEDELLLDDSSDDTEERVNRIDRRISKLTEKVKLTAEERDELKTLNESLATEKDTLAKERDFYKNFNEVSTKYQGAGEYQDKIFEKVKAGYDVEDATISILAKEGKYQPQVQPLEKETVAGGSAPTAMTGDGTKSPGQMTQEERRAALAELEAKGEFKL